MPSRAVLAAVGRFVFTVGALPAVVPVTFALDGEVAVCCTSAGSRLARAAAGGVLALQADDIDVASRSGWSVVATGVAEVVRDPAEVSRITGLVRPWVPGTLDVAIRLPLTVLTGRRVDTYLPRSSRSRGGTRPTPVGAEAADAGQTGHRRSRGSLRTSSRGRRGVSGTSSP